MLCAQGPAQLSGWHLLPSCTVANKLIDDVLLTAEARGLQRRTRHSFVGHATT